MNKRFYTHLLLCVGLLLINTMHAGKPINKDKDKSVIIYQSTANGVAEIKLILKPNHKFKFYMRIFPQASAEKESIVKGSGRWSQDDKWIKLLFRVKKIDLNALFDKNYAQNNEFRNVEKQSIEINNQLKVITIWGVACNKLIN